MLLVFWLAGMVGMVDAWRKGAITGLSAPAWKRYSAVGIDPLLQGQPLYNYRCGKQFRWWFQR
jgi:hypothetical protein